MLAGAERRGGLRVMKVIRRRDVNDLHPRVRQHRLEALIGGRQAQRAGAVRRPSVTRSDDPKHLHAKPAQGLDVNRANEAGPDDGSSDFADRPHSHGFFAEPRSLGVSEHQAATILLSSPARALASAGLAKRMKRALGCDPSRCGNLPGIRAPRLNMMEACVLSLTCTTVAKSPS